MMKKPLFYNKNINDYCKNMTNESIKRLTEKYNLERNNPKIKNPLDNNSNENPQLNFYNFLVFLSISTISFYFYKRLK